MCFESSHQYNELQQMNDSSCPKCLEDWAVESEKLGRPSNWGCFYGCRVNDAKHSEYHLAERVEREVEATVEGREYVAEEITDGRY